VRDVVTWHSARLIGLQSLTVTLKWTAGFERLKAAWRSATPSACNYTGAISVREVAAPP
jgi:hypothetical protein